MEVELFLIRLYVLVDDWWEVNQRAGRGRPGRPVLLSDAEVLTLAILAQ